jgi:hypothetical protein
MYLMYVNFFLHLQSLIWTSLLRYHRNAKRDCSLLCSKSSLGWILALLLREAINQALLLLEQHMHIIKWQRRALIENYDVFKLQENVLEMDFTCFFLRSFFSPQLLQLHSISDTTCDLSQTEL